MPRGKPAGTAPAARKPRGPKAAKLPESFAPGVILKDFMKKEWKLGKEIGQGGFGLIYLADVNGPSAVDSSSPFVVKIEPHSNGPLFCELHYYQRVAKPDMIDSWKKEKKLKYLGHPKFVATGTHTRDGVQYRFMVMERFGSDVQKIFENAGKRFERHTVCCLALRLIDVLEYIHQQSYVHADIKASNLLLGYKAGHEQPNEVYLVDYGLAVKYRMDAGHKEYKEDKRQTHNGTIEFTSTDAHLGVAPSRRGDMEIVGFCLLQWLCGRLPWESNLADKDFVASEKFKYTKNIASLMKACFKDGNIPDEIQKYFEMVKKLKYEDVPNYDDMRSLFRKGLNRLGVKDEWKLDLPLSGPSSPKKGVKRRSDEAVAGPSKAKQRAVDIGSSADQKAKQPIQKVTSKRKTTGLASPRSPGTRTPTSKQYTPLAASRRVKSPVEMVKTATAKASTPPPSQKAKGRPPKSPELFMNGDETNGGTPAKKVSTKRRVKRRKVPTVDASMQTSPP